MIAPTEAQLELLRDKYVLWDKAAREGPMDLRDYNRRATDALKAVLGVVQSAPQPAIMGRRETPESPPTPVAEHAELLSGQEARQLAAFLRSIAPSANFESNAKLINRAAELLEAPVSADHLLGALRDICNPLGALKRRADERGERLSGMAYEIANSVSFLQEIARTAIASAEAAQAQAGAKGEGDRCSRAVYEADSEGE